MNTGINSTLVILVQPFSGTGDMATDIKNATAMVQLWKKGLQGTAEKNIHEANAVVPDGNYMVPAEIIANCHGIAFLFFVKAGFIFRYFVC
jgi:hypothetical protein